MKEDVLTDNDESIIAFWIPCWAESSQPSTSLVVVANGLSAVPDIDNTGRIEWHRSTVKTTVNIERVIVARSDKLVAER